MTFPFLHQIECLALHLHKSIHSKISKHGTNINKKLFSTKEFLIDNVQTMCYLIIDTSFSKLFASWVSDSVCVLYSTIATRTQHKVSMVGKATIEYQVCSHSTGMQTDADVKVTVKVIDVTLQQTTLDIK